MTNAIARATDNLVRLREVSRRTGLHRATIYRKIAAGTFPQQRQLSQNCVGWYEAEINAWVAEPR
jgi:prophage regulatory protein